jgi:hypothetical protein
VSVQDESEICDLVRAIEAQTKAITQLANSNAMIAQALAEQIDDGEEEEHTTYLDGSPLGKR